MFKLDYLIAPFPIMQLLFFYCNDTGHSTERKNEISVLCMSYQSGSCFLSRTHLNQEKYENKVVSSFCGVHFSFQASYYCAVIYSH